MLMLSLVLTAAGPPAATAKSRPHAGAPASSRQPEAQVIRVSSRGFDWGDAGIGAIAGVGVSMLAVGGGLLIAGSRRRELSTAEATVGSAGAPTQGPLPLARPSVSTREREAR
jgi:hypothetical protein